MCFGGGSQGPAPPNVPDYSPQNSQVAVKMTMEPEKPEDPEKAPTQRASGSTTAGPGLNLKGM